MPEKTDTQMLKELLELTREIHAFFVMGQVTEPGQEEFRRAVAALESGNKSLLAAFFRRGGNPGKEDTEKAGNRGRQKSSPPKPGKKK